MSPFGARGLNSGLQDAENLAWKLGLVRAGQAPEALLATYEAERRAAAQENLRVTGATLRFLVPQGEREEAHRREVLERAAADPSARAAVDSGRLAEPFAYVASPLTTPSPGGGSLCPDGPVALPGRAEVTWLRQLFGRGFVVLTCATEVPAPALAAPVEVLRLDELDVEGVLVPALEATPGSVHVVRPDGHLAAVLPAADPDALARALHRATAMEEAARGWAAAMYAADRASQQLGIVISDVGPGRATARMTVTDTMVQGHGSCHGGYLFTLADSAFAFACNTYGSATVAAGADIVFVAPARSGDELVAEARERARFGRSGVYDVTVRRTGGDVVAEFRGRARTLNIPLAMPEDPAHA